MWPSSEVPAPKGMIGVRCVRSNAHDFAHLLGGLDPDHGIGRLVWDPGDGVGMLAAERLARLQAIAKALPQDRDGRSASLRPCHHRARLCHRHQLTP